MKAIIKSLKTGMYYCVPKELSNNTFPYWSKNVNAAHKFESVELAKHEMYYNDFDGLDAEIIPVEHLCPIDAAYESLINYLDNK